MKNVVVIGGGTGLSTLLRGLKLFPMNITAIVTVADDGASSGRLREEFNTPAVGDLRNVLVSLSEMEPLVEELLQYRFNTYSDLDKHALGNLILLIPNEHNQTQINNLKYNQQILVTPYDIYETLLDMSVYDKQWGSENNKGESLFNKINGLERDCEKYDDWDQRKQYFCVCDSWEY